MWLALSWLVSLAWCGLWLLQGGAVSLDGLSRAARWRSGPKKGIWIDMELNKAKTKRYRSGPVLLLLGLLDSRFAL